MRPKCRISFLIVTTFICTAGIFCGKKNSVTGPGPDNIIIPPHKAGVRITVVDDSSGVPIPNVNVIVYCRATDSIAATAATDSNGRCFAIVDTGSTYYIKTLPMAEYYQFPLPNEPITPFSVTVNDTTKRLVQLKKQQSLIMVCVHVVDDSASGTIPNANVVIFNANTNQPISRALTNAQGVCSLFVQPDNPYFLTVAAQGYRSSPPKGGYALPFQVGDVWVLRIVALRKLYSNQATGALSGIVQSTDDEKLSGILVVAAGYGDSVNMSGISGPDGYFTIYNIPVGLYSIQGYRAGWYQVEAIDSIAVKEAATTSGIVLILTHSSGSGLNGRITFLASHNHEVDITLVNPFTLEAIPGLSTFNTAGLTYALDSIPPGTYVPWATYRNDGYVMDPDWIRKFGLPIMTFAEGDGIKTLDFSITDAITIVSPTNPPDTIVPVVIDTLNPTFVWKDYPSAHEYIVGVFNAYGNLVWGGFDSTGRVLHRQIDAHTTSVVFNFDSSAAHGLSQGMRYRWKVWADKDASPGVQQLISSSEDLMGLFAISSPPEHTGNTKR